MPFSFLLISYARKNGYPVLHHVTLPRIGALKVITDTLAPERNATDENVANGNCKSTNNDNNKVCLYCACPFINIFAQGTLQNELTHP